MDKPPNVILYELITTHGQVTKAAIAAELGWGQIEIDQAIAVLIEIGLIDIVSHDPTGEPRYALSVPDSPPHKSTH